MRGRYAERNVRRQNGSYAPINIDSLHFFYGACKNKIIAKNGKLNFVFPQTGDCGEASSHDGVQFRLGHRI